jgi:hypothetical protein
VFAAVGDAGKSMLALRLANFVGSFPAPSSLALDVSSPRFFGQPVVGRGTAVFLTAEDDTDEVHRRLQSVDPSRAWGADSSHLIVIPLLSAGGARTIIFEGRNGPETTQAWHELRAQLAAIPDLRLVILDPLTQFVSGDMNDNAMGAALMSALNKLASESGATVMAIHHFNKTSKITSLSDARLAIRGAGALVDNGRWALVLWEAERAEAKNILKALGQKERAEQAGVVYFGGLAKGNAPSAKIVRTLVRNAAGGVLEDVTDTLRASTPRAVDVDDVLHAALLAIKHERTDFSFTSSTSALWEIFGGIIRKHDLPVTKDGKSRGKESVRAVFERFCDHGRLVRTGDRGGVARYEPVAIGAA